MAASIASQEHAVERAAKIFALLKQAAVRGQKCPTNATLAERFGCGTATIANAFHFLEGNAMIDVERGQCGRIVTICATGDRTAGHLREVHHTRKAA